MLDVSKVLVGAPDQTTTGAVMDGPVGTTLPTSAVDEIAEGFKSSGYISDDGLALTPDRSTTDINDWSGAAVRTFLKSFTATITWSEMEMSYDSLRHAFGEDNVKKIPATKDHGEQVVVSLNSSIPPARSWLFRMKDGATKIMIVVPNGQITAVDELDFTSSDAVKLPLTLSCHPDSTGNSIYIYTDDGVKASA
jgi:hypothetical protein